LTPDHSTRFSGEIWGQALGQAPADKLDLKDIGFGSPPTLGYPGGSLGGTLPASDGGQSAKHALLGNYLASAFPAASGGHDGPQITDPQTGHTPLLTQPHAA
jgi:hypothetical protein